MLLRNRWVVLLLTLVILIPVGGGFLLWKEKYGGGLNNKTRPREPLEVVDYLPRAADEYDVVVVGTDPEGIAGAVSAARNGLKTLLIDGRDRELLGGLMTLGWLNSLDNNYNKDNHDWLAAKPEVLNKGIFQEFYDAIEGTSFDVVTAANVFNRMVKAEKNIDLVLKAKSIRPVLEEGTEGRQRVTGIDVVYENGESHRIRSKAVIDATQDGDIYAAAGVPYSYGMEDLGDPDARMAVTIVFRLKNADERFWSQVRKKLEGDGDPNTGADLYSAWGYGDIKHYKAKNPDRAKMRGLNIGRQNDGTILINSLQLFGVDPTDPASVEEAYRIAEDELPHIVAFIKEKHPEFEPLELADEPLAPELYVRETRHMYGLYRLTIIDLLENRDHWDRVAFGSYRVDIQSTGPNDYGLEVMSPHKYAVPFRSLVPINVEGLLVVGRSASYDSLAHGSARVIPVGMAAAQSAGAAVKVALDAGVTFHEMAESRELISRMQELVNSQGMELHPYEPKQESHHSHPYYSGLKAAVYLGIGYARIGATNDFMLDELTNEQRWVNALRKVQRKYPQHFPGDPANALGDKKTEEAAKTPLSLEQAGYTLVQALNLEATKEQALEVLLDKGIVKPDTLDLIADPTGLTNGESYMLLLDLLERVVNIKF